ncbi:hypothetical protein BKA60DRAFT_537704 [Fusarium oxysporum]|nr:hypothetical protein BKA60DRAFT_537704 [Fusarium oxysporum]
MSKFLLANSPLAKKGASERMKDSGPVSWVLINKSPSDQKRLATTRQQVRQVKTASPLRELECGRNERDSWGQSQLRAKSLIQKRDFGTLVSRMKTRQGAGACPQTGTQISKSTELFNQQHGASSLALGIQSQFKSNKSKISIKIETVFGFSQGTENRSSREISKIEGGEGIIAVVKMSLTRPLLASSQKDAPIGLNEVGMTVVLRSKCPLTCFTGSCWKWGVETEKMLARLAFAQCWKLVISFHDLDPSLEKIQCCVSNQ